MLRHPDATPWPLLQAVLIAFLLIERRNRLSAERRARENLAQIAHVNRVAAIGELTGAFAHEINTPLGAALNDVRAARRYLANGPERTATVAACLEDIASDVCRAGDVVSRLRGVLRRETVREDVVSVSSVVADAVRLVGPEARDRDVDLTASVPEELPTVCGDKVQLVQVVLNLVMNAVDALASTPRERRRVSVDATAAPGGVEIRVADTGPGIPPAQLEKVFEPFFTTKPSGLGLGLAISRSIVVTHGGKMPAEPAGGGTVFRVWLPARGAERSGAA